MRHSVWSRTLVRHRARRWQSDAPKGQDSTAVKKPETSPEAAPPATPSETVPAAKDAKPKGDKSSGLLSSVFASMMKNDVRAAYECSLLPPEQQKEFLHHLREVETAERKAEIEKLKETGKAEIEVAKLKASSALQELTHRRTLEEEAETAKHVRQLEVLEKEMQRDVAMLKSKFQYQKWKAVAEREKRMRLKAEEQSKRKEHHLVLERLTKEHEAKKLANTEMLRVEDIRHKQSLELEAAKASAAKERLSENTAAIKMGPNAAIESVREEERQREEKQREERETQRQHEWELHNARLKEAEQRALEAASLGTATTRSEMIWRTAQIILATLALMGAYDWEVKKLSDRQAAREHEERTLKEQETADRERREAEVKAEKERRDAEHTAATQLAELSYQASIEVEEMKKAVVDLEIQKAHAWKQLMDAKERHSVAETEEKKVELKVAEAQIEANKIGLERMENVKRYLFLFVSCGIFGSMLMLGRAQ